jgi:hypothetical protein
MPVGGRRHSHADGSLLRPPRDSPIRPGYIGVPPGMSGIVADTSESPRHSTLPPIPIIQTCESTGVYSTRNGLVKDILDIHKTSEEPHKRIPLSQYWEDDLNHLSVTAGLLAVASYPLVTTEWSNTNGFHFSPKQVQSFAAWTVTIFNAVIVLCQQLKFSLRDDFRDESGTYKAVRRVLAICFRVLISLVFQSCPCLCV